MIKAFFQYSHENLRLMMKTVTELVCFSTNWSDCVSVDLEVSDLFHRCDKDTCEYHRTPVQSEATQKLR